MIYNKTIFVEKANEKHKNKYDYSLVDYINSQTKVKILCPVHGEFKQLPSSHLMGFGCQKCGFDASRKKKCSTKNKFCERANLLYGDKYDYSLVEYINEKTKTNIICPEHGTYSTTPERHLGGVGCPICSGVRLNHNELLKKFINIHGDKYDYSLVNYKDYITKVEIICLKHGIFKQSPAGHISGKGCPKCAIDFRANKKTYTTESYIRMANNKHNFIYDYSLVNYEHSQKKIKIICKIHGVFEQKPNLHLMGTKCPLCQRKKCSDNLLSNNTDFIKKAEIVHGNKYDYSLVDYIHSQKKIVINCLKHGKFKQRPIAHLMGRGCPICSESKGERCIRNILEKNHIEYVAQKTFNECRGKKNKLPFDFYLPQSNVLIEYNGEQHYTTVKYFGGKETFERIKWCDEIKKAFAKNNNINLIEIKYDSFDNIENILIDKKII